MNTRLGLGWRDSSIVAIDTVVRYRTFTQLRDALVLPVPTTKATVHGETLWVATERAGQTNVLPMPDARGVANSLATFRGSRSHHRDPCPIPPNCPIGQGPGTTDQIDYRNYVFEREKNTMAPDTTLDAAEEELRQPWARSYPRNYRLNYALDKLQTQLNNTFGTSFYQPYNGQVNAQPGLGNATEIRISDVMDDRHIVGGYTIPVNLSNTFFGLAFLNLEGQVDKEISFQRQSSARIDAGTGNSWKRPRTSCDASGVGPSTKCGACAGDWPPASTEMSFKARICSL